MATALRFYDSGGTIISSTGALVGDAGVPGTATVLQLINNKDQALIASGADTAYNVVIQIVGRDVGETNWVASGKEILDNHWVELRITEGVGKTVSATLWTAMGSNRLMNIPNLADEEGVKLEVRINAPPEVVDTSQQIAVRVYSTTYVPSAVGMTESAGDGVYLGLRDGSFNELVVGGNVVEDSPASMNVVVPDVIWISAGFPYSNQAQDILLTAAGGGNEKWALIYCASDGTVKAEYGSEVTAPVIDSDKPDIPEDGVPLAWVTVDDTSTVVDGDITNDWQNGLFAASDSGLTLNIGPGIAHVGGSLARITGVSALTLTDDDVNYVWLKSDGTFEVELTGLQPSDDPHAMLLYEVTTAAGSVTGTVDQRQFTGVHLYALRFDWQGTLSTSSWRYAINPSARKAFLLPLNPMVAGISTNAGTSGNSVWDVEVDGTSIFATGGTEPTIAWDAGNRAYDESAIPEDYEIPRFAEIRASLQTLPSGGTPSDGHLTLLISM